VAICGKGSILGPYFFENNLNGHLDFIDNEIVPQMMETFNYNLFVVVSRWCSPSHAK